MPVVVELLLLDAEEKAAAAFRAATAGRSGKDIEKRLLLLTADGVYQELSRQLQDEKSVLRANSAFGIVVSKGASLRLLKQCAAKAEPVPQVELRPLIISNEADPKVKQEEASFGLKQCFPREEAVPRIRAFPGMRSTYWPAFLEQALASCAPEACTGRCERPRAHVVSMCGARCSPEFQERTQQLLALSPEQAASIYEAGLGGWPLCMPYVYVAFREPTHADSGAGVAKKVDDFPSATPRLEGQTKSIFHRVALEVDDDEVMILLATRSIAVSEDSPVASLPHWVRSSRVVVPTSSVTHCKRWATGDVTKIWHGNHEPLFSHCVQLSCSLPFAPDGTELLIALPSPEIAARLHSALSRNAVSMSGPPEQERERAAMHCELQLLAHIDLEVEMHAHDGCAASVKRAIVDAIGVNLRRVQVLSVRDGGGTLLGWAAAHASNLRNAIGA